MTIPDELLDAYRATCFRVTGVPDPFVLRVGRYSAELEALHQAHQVSSSAFITAWNPGSRPHAEEENRIAQAQMEAALEAVGHALLAGLGEDPSGRWPGEESVLVLGMARDEAETVGREYGQNAVVWIGAEAVPELVLSA